MVVKCVNAARCVKTVFVLNTVLLPERQLILKSPANCARKEQKDQRVLCLSGRKHEAHSLKVILFWLSCPQSNTRNFLPKAHNNVGQVDSVRIKRRSRYLLTTFPTSF